MTVVNLTPRPTGPASFVYEVPVQVDGHEISFLFDTGAVCTSLADGAATIKYESLGQQSSRGASGVEAHEEMIQPDVLKFGDLALRRPIIRKGKTSVLGLDLIGKSDFEIDLKNHRLILNPETPSASAAPIRRLSPGHIVISISASSQPVDALFDSGADTCVVDLRLIEDNPLRFDFVRKENGTDAHGNTISSKIYSCRSFKVGTVEMVDVELAAFQFGEDLRSKMEGVPLILGNNVISQARWTFALKTGAWSAASYN